MLRFRGQGVIEGQAHTAWHELESKLRPFIARRVAAQADVDDVLQDVFVRLLRGLPELRDEQRFGPWVYRIARNTIIDHQRKVARQPVTVEQLPEPAALQEDEQTVEQEVAGYIALFIAMLPAPYRQALTLTELEGLSQTEAAKMLGISVSGMKSRVQRGRRKLRAALEDCCHFALDARQRVIACEPRPDGRLPDGCSCTDSSAPVR